MASVYEIITQTIIDRLSAGDIPWKKSWRSERPTSYATKKAYSGLNALYLNALSVQKGYSRNVWLTFNQAKKVGGSVRKGERSAIISYYKMIQKEQDGKEKTIPFLRYFRVFNVDQCNGVPMDAFPLPESGISENQNAESVWNAYRNTSGVSFSEGAGLNPCYIPAKDTICMPFANQFNSVDEYYSTLFHEAGHSTGHESRLNRDKNAGNRTEYSKEELVAEFCAAFVCAELGIDQVIPNSAAYIQGWSKALKNDPRMVTSAASKGEKAADLILGR